jgi:hypothetical protein
MDKNILIICVCGIIIFIIFLQMDKKYSVQKNNTVDFERFDPKENIIESNKVFDPYTFYTSLNKQSTKNNITKDNFDFDYETDFKYKDNIVENFSDDNLKAQGDDRLSIIERTNIIKRNAPLNDLDESPNCIDNNFLIDHDLESNGIFSMPFPENTSGELPLFTAENVTNKYDANNMQNLYNTINNDVYKGYKTLNYML